MPVDGIFAGETETAQLMAKHDWSATSLGSPAGWPQSLRTIVPIMLASRFAMRVMWGRDDMLLLYNDNYRPVLGATKHPSALGRPMRLSYGELWHVVGPLFQRVLDGESIALEDSLLPLDRAGFQRRSQVDACAAKRGREPENNARQYRRRKRE